MQTSSSRARLVVSLAALAVAAPALSGCGVNAIPTKDEAVKAAWGDVQSQYQRRANLIPNLVATVQGAAANERAILVDVQNARSKATSITVNDVGDAAKMGQYQQAQGELSQALGRLMVVQERYPDLKTNQNFIALQSQLEGTENRIQVSVRDYNGAVQSYNTTLRTFPTVIWAKTMYSGQKEAQPFAATAAAQTAPTVNFNIPGPGQMGAPAAGPAPMGGAPSAASAMPGSSSSTTTTTTTAPAR